MNTKEQLEAMVRRISTCFSCDRLDAVTGQCGECGCEVVNLTRLVGSPCPIGKFPGEDVNA